MKLHKTLCFMFVIVFLITASQVTWGQTENEKEQKLDAEREKLVTKIFKIQYADAKELREILLPFISLGKNVYADMVVNEHFNTITVRDYPEKIAVIAEVIKQFDVKPVEVEFTFHLLEASDIPKPEKPVPPVEPETPIKPAQPVKSVPPAPPLPPDVEKVVEKLQTNFTYKYYHLLDSAILKSSESKYARISLGGSSSYVLDIRWSLLSADSSVIKISYFKLVRFGKSGRPVLETSLMVEDGETAVVGTSKASSDDSALVTIIKARMLKE